MAVIDPEKLKEAAPRLLKALLEAYFYSEGAHEEIEEGLKAVGLDTFDKIHEAAVEMEIF